MSATPLSRLHPLLPSALGASLLGCWLLLSGCESRHTPIPWLNARPAAPKLAQLPGADTVTDAPPALAEDEPEAAPSPPYQMLAEDTLRYRRYVGWLGARPVVVELFVGREYAGQSPPQVFGRYYDARTGTEHYFPAVDFSPRQRIRLKTYADNDSAEHWQLPPLGARLTGTVTAGGQPPRRFTLREDYRQAAALAVCSAVMYGRSEPAYGQENEPEPRQYRGICRRQYIWLRGKAAQRPILQRAFPSRPAQIRAWLLEDAGEETEALQIDDYEFDIELNDYNILSYRRTVSTDANGANHPDSSWEEFSYDLRTGRRLSLATLLRRGSGPALQRLMLRYMEPNYLAALQEQGNDPLGNIEERETLHQTSSFSLTPSGLSMTMKLGSHAMGPTTIVIPYAALRPLLRPRTPLNRLLMARDLPPVL